MRLRELQRPAASVSVAVHRLTGTWTPFDSPVHRSSGAAVASDSAVFPAREPVAVAAFGHRQPHVGARGGWASLHRRKPERSEETVDRDKPKKESRRSRAV